MAGDRLEKVPDPLEGLDPDDLTPEEKEAIAQPNNAANPIAVRRKAKEAEKKQKDINSLLAGLLTVKEGRMFIGWLLIELCGLFEQEAPVSMDSNVLQFRAGARGVAVDLHKLFLRVDRKQYMDTLSEYLGKM